ncbi:MAG: radical SAM protein [Candidatus Omnitrophica bacterium]|nr:radical SAM protein [Candidatus Omnitrophota bacterium]
MNILLLNPIYFDPIRYPPINLTYLASSLRSAGECVSIVDTNIDHACIDKIKQFNPDIVGLPMMSFSEPMVIDFIRKIKRITPAKILIGGPHACIMQEEVLKIYREIDFEIFGEGEKTVQELCNALKRKTGLESVKGLIYREGGEVRKNQPREFNHNLDELPFPAWDLLEVKKYNFLPIADSRGCPYRCNFCCVKDIQGRLWRPRSWESIIAEIQWDMKKFGFKKFYIDGDNLLVDRNRILKLCDEIRKRNLQIKWTATQGVRADLVTDEILSAMLSAGCRAIGFGIESGDEKVLRSMQKGESLEKIAYAARLAKKKGFYVTGCFMVGNINDTTDSVKRSIEFMKSLKLNAIYVNSVVPYPKTELWKWAEEQGINLNKDAMYFPPTLQEDKIEPAFETKEFSKKERIEAYRLFRKAAFWSTVRSNIFRRSLLRIIIERLKYYSIRLTCRLKNKNIRELILEKCDLWRNIPLD